MRTCACISVLVRGFSCKCMCPFCVDQTWTFLWRRKQLTVLMLSWVLSLAWRPGLHCWSSVSLHTEARPCSQLFVQLAHQRGHQGRKPPPPTQTQPDTSTAAPTQVTNLLTPSPAGYLLRGHRLRRVFCSALIWFTVSAQALVISAIDLPQMS